MPETRRELTPPTAIPLREVAEALAPFLAEDGYTLTITPEAFHPSYRFTHPDGRAFVLVEGPTYTKAGAGRFEVYGDWPRHPNGSHYTARDWLGEDRPTATFRRDREPAKLAADLRRRFLAEYERLHTLCEAKATEVGAQYTRARDQLTTLATALGTEPPRHVYNPWTFTLIRHTDAGSVQATVTSISFHGLSIEAILALIATWQEATHVTP